MEEDRHGRDAREVTRGQGKNRNRQYKTWVRNFVWLLITPIWAETPSKIVQINSQHAERRAEEGCVYLYDFSQKRNA